MVHSITDRAGCDALKPESTPQAVWDALNDDLDRQEAVEYADLIKAVQQYEEDNPDEPREPLESEESVISPVAVE